jgi:hypothetical protein
MFGRCRQILIIAAISFMLTTASLCVKAYASINPPANPVRLIFIHHSTGENWLSDSNGGLGIALRDNNYFVSDTNYDWTLTASVVAQTSDIGGSGSVVPVAQRTLVHFTPRESITPNILACQLTSAAKTRLLCSNTAFQILP